MRTNSLSIGLFCMLMLSAVLVYAEEFEKTITRSFDVNKDARFMLEQEFGDVVIENWNQNRIEIEIVITVDAKNRERADEFFEDRVEVSMEGNRNEVEVVAGLEGGNNNRYGDFNIDVNIKMPATLDFHLEQGFGNTRMGDHSGKFHADMSHSNLNVGTIKGNMNMADLQFSNLNAKCWDGGTLDLSHSNFKAPCLKNVSVELRFSNIKTDDYTGNADFKLKHSNIKFGNWAGLEKGRIDMQFSTLKAEMEESDFNLHVDESFSGVDVPAGGEKDLIDKDYNSSEYKYIYSSGNKWVEVSMRHSSLKMD